MKSRFLLFSLFFLILFVGQAQDDQNALLKSLFSEAGNSYTWNFELITPSVSKELIYADNSVKLEFIPMTENQLTGPYQWSFWFTNNTASNIEINWEKSYITSFKGTQRKVYHGALESVSSTPQENTIVPAKSKVGDAVVPKGSVTTAHHAGEYNDQGEWVNEWNEITGYQLFYGEDFPADYTYETVKASCVGKDFKLHLVCVVNGSEKNYDFTFKVTSIDKATSADNPLLDAMNEKAPTEIVVGTRVKGNFKNQGIFYPGKIIEINGDQYHIEYDDGDKEWTTKAMFTVQN